MQKIVRKAVLAMALALCCAAMSTPTLRAEPVVAVAAKTGILPGDDFFDYVNADWLNSVEIPADRGSWSAGAALVEDTNQRILKLIEGMAAQPPSAEAKQVADYYAAFMDEA